MQLSKIEPTIIRLTIIRSLTVISVFKIIISSQELTRSKLRILSTLSQISKYVSLSFALKFMEVIQIPTVKSAGVTIQKLFCPSPYLHKQGLVSRKT